MTNEEHELMITMLARQAQAIESILTLLESRGILEGDDRKGFADLVRSTLPFELQKKWTVSYLVAAKQLGIALDPQVFLPN